jgi:uncharacterized protein (TIGR02145 family)
MKNIFKIFSLLILVLCVCSNAEAQVPGTPYILPAQPSTNGVIPGNTFCAGKTISVTSCTAISGATINDDVATTAGIEYDWTGATGYIASNTTTRALVEINGQCWYRINADRVPSNYSTPPSWGTTNNGAHGYYTGGPYTNEGRLYTNIAANNGSTAERTQGVCAPGFHIPSDCEWMYLESTGGMTLTDQQLGWTSSRMSNRSWYTSLNGGSNTSGFTILNGGWYEPSVTSFQSRGCCTSLLGYVGFWSSYNGGGRHLWRYGINGGNGILRETGINTDGRGNFVRCLAD